MNTRQWVTALVVLGSCGAPMAAQPLGALTSQDGPRFVGWACDPDAPASPPAVDFYANGSASVGEDRQPLPAWARYRGPNRQPDHFAGSAAAMAPVPTGAQVPETCAGGAKGFSFELPRAFRSQLGPGQHRIHVFLRRTGSTGANPSLTGSPFILSITGRQRPVGEWFQGFRHGCNSWKDKSWPDRGPQRQDPKPSYSFKEPADGCATDYPTGFKIGRDPFWVLESTNETRTFAPVYDREGTGAPASIDFEPNKASRKGGVPVWRIETQKSPRGGRVVTHVLDKKRGRSAGTPLDSYSAAFIQTELGGQTPDLGSNPLFLELWWRVSQAEGARILPSDVAAGLTLDDHATLSSLGLLPARYRMAVGLILGSPGQPVRRMIEVNLVRSDHEPRQPPNLASFDLCTPKTLIEGLQPPMACEQAARDGPYRGDDIGLFDRRSVSNPIVYFDMREMHRVYGLPQPSGQEAGFQRVLIPVHALLRNAPWTDRPGLTAALPQKDGLADLGGQRLLALYLGSEIWGKARFAVQFERLGLFTFEAD